jgi:predicted nucleotidyltransferase
LAQLQTDLSEFVELLNSRKVEYLVVGGHAVAFHGHPRFTGDIDFFVNASRENAERVVNVLASLGFGDLGITVDDLTAPDRVVQLGRPPNRIDLLTTISGVSFGDAWIARAPGDLGGHPVNFLGWDDLIRNKTASGRDKDQLDVKTLLKIAARKGRGG